jgi:hypothetical protein
MCISRMNGRITDESLVLYILLHRWQIDQEKASTWSLKGAATYHLPNKPSHDGPDTVTYFPRPAHHDSSLWPSKVSFLS